MTIQNENKTTKPSTGPSNTSKFRSSSSSNDGHDRERPRCTQRKGLDDHSTAADGLKNNDVDDADDNAASNSNEAAQREAEARRTLVSASGEKLSDGGTDLHDEYFGGTGHCGGIQGSTSRTENNIRGDGTTGERAIHEYIGRDAAGDDALLAAGEDRPIDISRGQDDIGEDNVSSSESSILDVGAVQALLQKNLDASLSVLENRSNAEEESPRNDDDEEDIISTSESSVLDFGAVNALLQNNLVNALSLLEDDDEESAARRRKREVSDLLSATSPTEGSVAEEVASISRKRPRTSVQFSVPIPAIDHDENGGYHDRKHFGLIEGMGGGEGEFNIQHLHCQFVYRLFTYECYIIHHRGSRQRGERRAIGMLPSNRVAPY